MPVHLRPDELEALPKTPTPEIQEEAESTLVPEMISAFRACIVWLVIAWAALLGGLTLMQKTLIAAEKLRRFGKGDYWQETWTPMALFAIFGAAIGFFLASRLSLSDVLAWVAVGLMALTLLVVGAIYASILFTAGVPVMCWIGLLVMVAAAVGGAIFQTRWSA